VRRHFVTPNEWHLVDNQARGITKVESCVLMRTVENHRKIKDTSRANIAVLGVSCNLFCLCLLAPRVPQHSFNSYWRNFWQYIVDASCIFDMCRLQR